MQRGHELPGVARRAIAEHLRAGAAKSEGALDAPRHAVFVTLRDGSGHLRGCLGSLSAIKGDVVAETARVAVLAATSDPRFPGVQPNELPSLSIEVSVLGSEEPVASDTDLDPRIYGVVVRDGEGRQAVLLPGIPGIEDGATQVRLARAKAGVAENAAVRLSRFAVHKYYESRGGGGRSRD